MGSDGAIEWMKRLREAPTRSGRPKLAPGVEPGDTNQTLLRRLAEADAGIEHDPLARDAGACRDVERAPKEVRHLGDDIDRRIGGSRDCA